MDPGFSNIPNNQIKNYLQNAAAHKPGITHDEVKDYYNKWSLKYEQDLNETVYRGPKIAANLCDTFVWDKLNSNILDIGCGTGLIGEHLAKSGFKWIDGLEPCENMVKVARSKNIYRRFFMETIRDEVDTSLPDDFYDACVISGAFGEGHIPSNGLYEILRVVKPGGYVINVMRREYLDYVNDYVDRLEPLMEHMEKVENKWTLITKFDVDNYSFNKTGRIYVFRKN